MMRSIINREHWDYERREDGHYFTNDKGYFVLPLDLNNDPKEREYYCYFSFFLKEEYKDVEQDEVEEYVKWFFIYLSNGNLKRSSLTYDYKFYQEGKFRTKKEGYLEYVFVINKEDMIETLSEGFTLVELYLRDMGIDFNYPRRHYNTFYILNKKKLMGKINLNYYEISDVYLAETRVNFQLQYNDFVITIFRYLKDKTPYYVLNSLKSVEENFTKERLVDLSDVLGIIYGEDETKFDDEIVTLLENDIDKLASVVSSHYEEKKISSEFTDILEEEIFFIPFNMSLSDNVKEKFTLKRMKNRE